MTKDSCVFSKIIYHLLLKRCIHIA
jgi:hypothetical protein